MKLMNKNMKILIDLELVEFLIEMKYFNININYNNNNKNKN